MKRLNFRIVLVTIASAIVATLVLFLLYPTRTISVRYQAVTADAVPEFVIREDQDVDYIIVNNVVYLQTQKLLAARLLVTAVSRHDWNKSRIVELVENVPELRERISTVGDQWYLGASGRNK